MATVATLWGIRLTANFYRKGGYSAGEEDYRWAEVRKMFPHPFVQFLFAIGFVFIAQHLLLWLIALPAHYISRSPDLSWTDGLLFALYLGLLAMETVADQQQWLFHQRKARKQREDPDVRRGFLTQGLFRFSRHPNFFAEVSMWHVFYVFSALGPEGPLNWSLAGPVGLLLIFVASTPLTERLSSEKYPRYVEYQRTTSRLIPWLPGEPLKED